MITNLIEQAKGLYISVWPVVIFAGGYICGRLF